VPEDSALPKKTVTYFSWYMKLASFFCISSTFTGTLLLLLKPMTFASEVSESEGPSPWGLLLLLFTLVWTAFPSSDYYALSATSSGHWLFGERLPLSYFPSAFASLRKLPVFSKKDSNAMP
jgi:hypothetical protein